jgi:hypothetical protein
MGIKPGRRACAGLIYSGWWLGTMEFYDFPIILGILWSSQLTTPSFFKMVKTTNQIGISWGYGAISWGSNSS